jgi:hypothetical protein
MLGGNIFLGGVGDARRSGEQCRAKAQHYQSNRSR